jgi:single-strand DNA-binding protein
MYLNRAQLIGNLTRDPELKSLPTGNKVVNFSLATNRFWKDQNGAKQESTDYHNVVAFGRTAETVAQYMRKGNSMYVEGRLQTRSWEADGKKNYRTEVIADSVQFGPRGGAAPAGGNAPAAAAPAPASTDAPFPSDTPPAVDTIEYPEEDINPEDIPF